MSESKPNDFVVKRALATFASILEDDDIGYFYDPASPKEICTNPGSLVGKIANSHLPYGFDFRKGVDHFVLILKTISDQDYNKVGLIVSDCFTKGELDHVMEKIATLNNTKIYVIGIGSGTTVGGDMMYLQDASELSNKLKEIGESL